MVFIFGKYNFLWIKIGNKVKNLENLNDIKVNKNLGLLIRIGNRKECLEMERYVCMCRFGFFLFDYSIKVNLGMFRLFNIIGFEIFLYFILDSIICYYFVFYFN